MTLEARCSVPAFDGVLFSHQWRDALWDKYFTRAPARSRAVRRAIQQSQESLIILANRHGITPKTVAKWKRRTSVHDLPTGPKQAKSTTLSSEEEASIVAFRRQTLLPQDDCLYAVQAT